MSESGSRLGGLAPAASEGFKNAAAYDAHRPAYPPKAVNALLERMRLPLSKGDVEDVDLVEEKEGGGKGGGEVKVRIVEIAAGTGKFTEALVNAAAAAAQKQKNKGDEGEEEGVKVEILATEPHPDMLRELEGKKLPGVVVRRGGAEELARVVLGEGEGDGWADGVIAAQAFHW